MVLYISAFGLCKKKEEKSLTRHTYTKRKERKRKKRERESYSSETPLVETSMNVCQQL
jgi:hypothetical protein